MSVASTVEVFATGTYAVTRYATGAVVDGIIQPGAPTTLEVSASVQPLGGRELMRLPEGETGQDRRLVFSGVRLFSGPNPDYIEIDGETFQVEVVEDWSALGGYFKSTVVRGGHD